MRIYLLLIGNLSKHMEENPPNTPWEKLSNLLLRQSQVLPSKNYTGKMDKQALYAWVH
jgi:hypothetical protein